MICTIDSSVIGVSRIRNATPGLLICNNNFVSIDDGKSLSIYKLLKAFGKCAVDIPCSKIQVYCVCNMNNRTLNSKDTDEKFEMKLTIDMK